MEQSTYLRSQVDVVGERNDQRRKQHATESQYIACRTAVDCFQLGLEKTKAEARQS